MDITQLFFQLIQVAISKRNHLDVTPSFEEWKVLCEISNQQSLMAVCFSGVEALPKEQMPDKNMIMLWFGYTHNIELKNSEMDGECGRLCKDFTQLGYDSCILKGQTNRFYYPENLRSRRNPGDIDIWVYPKGNKADPVKQTILLLEKKKVIKSLAYLHAELIPVDSIPVEVHFRPTFLNDPLRNYRLQKWFDNHRGECTNIQTIDKDITIPMLRPVYNIIFQLIHIYRHLLDEGIGLRQVLDYYFLLISTVAELSPAEMEEINKWLSHFGLRKIASALMYVLHKVFGLEEHYMIIDPSKKDGEFLLSEIMTAGNFGHFDPRLKKLGGRVHTTSYQVRHALRRYNRNMRFFTSYPSEVFWEPIVRVCHFWWRKFKLWKY